MESIVESYVSSIRNLIEEAKYGFDDDLQSIKERFDDDIEECDKRLDKTCLSSSRFLMEGVKEELTKLAIREMQVSLKEITKHVEWAVEQRKQIQVNANKRLISEFSNSISSFFEQDLRGQFLKLNNLDAIVQEGDKATGYRKLANDFREELKKGVEPFKNLFKKEIQNFSKDLRLVEDSIPAKLAALSKQNKLLEFNLYSESAIKGRQANCKLFSGVFENLNKLTDKLVDEKRELNDRIRCNLEVSLQRNRALINGKFDEFQREHQKFLLEAAEQKADFNKETNAYNEKCRKQIRLLLDDLVKEGTTFNFNDLAMKVLNSKLDADLENAWFKFFHQIKSHAQSQSLDFELGYLDLINLRGDLESCFEQRLDTILKPSAEKLAADLQTTALKTELDIPVSTQYVEASFSHSLN